MFTLIVFQKFVDVIFWTLSENAQCLTLTFSSHTLVSCHVSHFGTGVVFYHFPFPTASLTVPRIRFAIINFPPVWFISGTRFDIDDRTPPTNLSNPWGTFNRKYFPHPRLSLDLSFRTLKNRTKMSVKQTIRIRVAQLIYVLCSTFFTYIFSFHVIYYSP